MAVSAGIHPATWRWLVVASWLAVASPVLAHPVPFSYVDLRVRTEGLDATVVVHVFDVAHDLGIEPVDRLLDPAFLATQRDAIAALLAPRFTLTVDGAAATARWSAPEPLAERQSLRFRVTYEPGHAPGVLRFGASAFPYDPEHRTFLNIYEGEGLAAQEILDVRRTEAEYFTGTRQGVWAVIRRFVPSGTHHILIGPDHLLFLVGLLLTGGTFRRLLLVVTAFTVAHSLTLSLAALGLVMPPPQVIEPAIALSIVYVGIDNLLRRDGRDMRMWIACAFGFIHGFGFANVLREMGLPPRALGWSLFSFNVGVELGQIAVVTIVASGLYAVRSRSEAIGRRLASGGSVAVIAAGAYWFVERTFFPGGW
jgi:hydrogenase/urease accessory protein HupE